MAETSRRGALSCLLLASLAIPLAVAQTVTGGTLTGTVTDQQGGVIPRTEILAKNDGTGLVSRASTNEVGVWVISPLPGGDYTITVTAQGFTTATFTAVKLDAVKTITVNASLKVGFADMLTVTASKVEQDVLNAPATVTVIPEQAIRASPARNVTDLLRAVPGMNVIQTSAYTFFTNGRAAAGLYSDAQLGLVDGRSIYIDYLGALDWNTVTADLEEIKQVEVIRGPDSAVWGAYAMNGVINIITTPPREMLGTALTLGIGAFDRTGGAAQSNTGSLFYAKAAHAQALNDQWAYKVTTGAYTQDAFARPQGTFPNDFRTPYPSYPNKGTTNPKADGRVDYDFPDGKQRFTLGGGFTTSSGTATTTLGPLDCRPCAAGYGKADYTRGALRISGFVNAAKVDSPALLLKDPADQPVQWRGDTQTYDIGFSNFNTIAAKHLISYGGNFRHNQFNHSVLPGVTSRDDGGAYAQDDFLVSEHFRWVFGGRIDKFENLKGVVFSPRTTLVMKPTDRQTFRLSYNRAYVAPSVINNYLRLVYIMPIQLGGPTPFRNPVHLEGNPDLKKKSLNAYEIGYTAIVVKGRANIGAAFYVNDGNGWFYSPVVGYYSSADPPAGWPLPPVVLDNLIAMGKGLPKTVRSDNLGRVRNKGLELSAEVQIRRFVNGYANYSWQALPDVKDPGEIPNYNKPPAHRLNAGTRFDWTRYFGNASVSHVDDAVWNDILPWWRGPTKAYTTVNFGVGRDFGEDRKYTAILKVTNLANTPIRNHIFGDILKRQVSAEFKIRF